MTGALPLPLALYRAAAAMASPLAPAWIGYRARVGKEDQARWPERLGRASLPRPAGRLAWLHGVSVGEGLSLLPLVRMLRAERSDVAVLVTSGTVSSAAVLAQRLPEGVIHQYAPLDTPRVIAAFLDHWRPQLGVFVESEIWPNLILAAKARDARMAIVSARLSPASLSRWRWAPAAARKVFSAFDVILARDAAAAKGLATLGIGVSGMADAKFAAPSLPVDARELALLRQMLGERPVIFAASTHAGEEELIAERFRDAAPAGAGRSLLVLAPRHPARAAAIDAAMRRMGLASGRVSLGAEAAGLDVLVADELGHLGPWYAVAAIAIVGGSLVKGVGGHNPLEPARLGCPIVCGPWVDGWPVYASLIAVGAVRQTSGGEDLTTIVGQAIAAPEAFRDQAAKAADFARATETETSAALHRIVGLIDP